jgi:hypothetical protein
MSVPSIQRTRCSMLAVVALLLTGCADQTATAPSVIPPGSGSVTVTNLNPPSAGCTLTQGYWKNHTGEWNQTSDPNTAPFITSTAFFNSGRTYIVIMNTPPAGGNAYLQLAHQYIAARLNRGEGASAPANVLDAISGATTYFSGAPAGIPNPTGSVRTQLQTWATLLDNYNRGFVGPGHCPE